MTQPAILKRTLSLPMMILYGLGTTIGVGICALVGEIGRDGRLLRTAVPATEVPAPFRKG